MVLTEGIAQDQSTTSQKLLVDLGVNVPRLGSHNIPKKAPHEKYYWSQSRISFNSLILSLYNWEERIYSSKSSWIQEFEVLIKY